jgi:hypothetical protein
MLVPKMAKNGFWSASAYMVYGFSDEPILAVLKE